MRHQDHCILKELPFLADRRFIPLDDTRFEFQQIDLEDFPNVERWYLALADRPAFQRGYAVPNENWVIPRP